MKERRERKKRGKLEPVEVDAIAPKLAALHFLAFSRRGRGERESDLERPALLSIILLHSLTVIKIPIPIPESREVSTRRSKFGLRSLEDAVELGLEGKVKKGEKSATGLDLKS